MKNDLYKKMSAGGTRSLFAQRKKLFSLFFYTFRAQIVFTKSVGALLCDSFRAQMLMIGRFFKESDFFPTQTKCWRKSKRIVILYFIFRCIATNIFYRRERASSFWAKWRYTRYIEQVDGKMVYSRDRNVSPSWYAVQM